ncbi:hypothetical protein GCM10027258_92850 [Amycolatopsis stemonae]
MSDRSGWADLNVETARLGAMLAGKGLSPDQVARLIRERVQPVLAAAVELVDGGADIDTIEFGLRYPGREGHGRPSS